MNCVRIAPGILLAVLAFAQAPSELFEQPPPQLDQALRARVTKFYQAHMDGKFRVADQLVAEDSKDAFLEADKTRYKGFEILKIVYSEQFTRARVLTSCESELITPVMRFPAKLPLTTLWRLENGEWFWYVIPLPPGAQPIFGKPGESVPAQSPAPPGGASVPARVPTASEVLNQVTVSDSQVRLSSYEPASDTVTISNRMPGSVSLALSYTGFPGFTARLDRTELAAGESAKLLLEVKPQDRRPKPTLTLEVSVEPTGRVFPIRVLFTPPPEIQKTLPK